MSSDTGPQPGFLFHREGDSVAVAVDDLGPGPVQGGYVAGPQTVELQLLEPIPLGHKLAAVAIAQGEPVIEYGEPVAIATRDIAIGEHVHVHNVRSARWPRSIVD